ncbi:ABC transporter ATP-binding protein [uncultured Aeromicrobium sp.]|uniref:ABC transporter ATP-binding protein n=1 Tax=uncultured Aeromicrobium sp. TaxID=337820 RepID=UPI0025FCFEC0|nr:sn-glycerol-3-phosphate ABC transporter ATP-binding protein UgpC [uncultured Aeromicrobium sp.]
MASIHFDQACRVYPGTSTPAVDKLDLTINDGELVVLVGPSGCGKSTSLRMTAGLEDVTSGAIRIDDQDVTHLPPSARDIAMVFQNYALYPHMTVADNIGFSLKIARVPKAERTRRVREAAAMLDLLPLLDRKPKALSGGQRQRVAMGRAVVREPRAFLMDEPLSNLDAKLRVQTRTQIADLQRRLGATMLYVTHDQTEAMTMGDRIAVLKDGVLQQYDTPRMVYERPANAFVAAFIGSPPMNLIDAELINGRAEVCGVPIDVDRSATTAAQAEGAGITLGIRPEDFVVAETGLRLQVSVVEELGADAYVYGHLDDRPDHTIVVRVDGRNPPAKGTRLTVMPRPDHVHAFSTLSGARL